jgi:hypothetical protein
MLIAVLFVGVLLALALIVLGFLIEANNAAYKPASEPFGIHVDDHERFEADAIPSPYTSGRLFPDIQLDVVSMSGAVLWLAFLVPLVDHLLSLQESWTSFIVWAITIGPHEMGHFLFMPFGSELLMFLGGSIWQVLFFALLGLWGLLVRKQFAGPMLMFMVVGHSFLNMSVYIADAQERDLDLILGMDASRHDWWNILGTLGLLEHDDTIAMVVRVLGVLIVLGVIGIGVWQSIRVPIWHTKQEDFPEII